MVKLKVAFKLCTAYIDARLGLGLIAITNATGNASAWLVRHGYRTAMDAVNEIENNKEELGITPEKYSEFCESCERLKASAPEDWR